MSKYPDCDNDNTVMIALSALTQPHVVLCCDCCPLLYGLPL